MMCLDTSLKFATVPTHLWGHRLSFQDPNNLKCDRKTGLWCLPWRVEPNRHAALPPVLLPSPPLYWCQWWEIVICIRCRWHFLNPLDCRLACRWDSITCCNAYQMWRKCLLFILDRGHVKRLFLREIIINFIRSLLSSCRDAIVVRGLDSRNHYRPLLGWLEVVLQKRSAVSRVWLVLPLDPSVCDWYAVE